MSYTHDELALIAEALQFFLENEEQPHNKRKRAKVNQLADKVVNDQSNKATA